MTTSTVTPEIIAFAQGVRAALADLPPEEVDDLTEGLEADLAEAYAEDLQRELPDPAAYAVELRTAAGLPERETARRTLLSGLAGGWNDTRRDLALAVRRNPVLAAGADFLDAIRPLWWVVRAWLATWLLAAFFGMERDYWMDGAWWLVLVVFVVVSVQWGRGRWHGTGVPALLMVGNVFAALVLLPVLAAAGDGGYGDYSAGYEDAVTEQQVAAEGQGLAFNGQPLENVYVYDAKGRPLRNVQLFDVDGTPLVPNRDVYTTSVLQTPATLETGVPAYNVYPLEVVRATENENGEMVPDPSPDPGKAAAYRNGPFVKVPAVEVPRKVAKSNR